MPEKSDGFLSGEAAEKAAAAPKKKKKKTSGSETRERGGMVAFRVSPAERVEIEEAASAAGLSLASYVRGLVLDAPQTKKTRKPSIDRAALAQILAHVGKIGSNINQIARRLNQGKGVGFERLGAVLDEVAEIKAAILEALKGVK